MHETSRLARRNRVAPKFVDALGHHGVSPYGHAYGIETAFRTGGAILMIAPEVLKGPFVELRIYRLGTVNRWLPHEKQGPVS